jgi:hypothetical protein
VLATQSNASKASQQRPHPDHARRQSTARRAARGLVETYQDRARGKGAKKLLQNTVSTVVQIRSTSIDSAKRRRVRQANTRGVRSRTVGDQYLRWLGSLSGHDLSRNTQTTLEAVLVNNAAWSGCSLLSRTSSSMQAARLMQYNMRLHGARVSIACLFVADSPGSSRNKSSSVMRGSTLTYEERKARLLGKKSAKAVEVVRVSLAAGMDLARTLVIRLRECWAFL